MLTGASSNKGTRNACRFPKNTQSSSRCHRPSLQSAPTLHRRIPLKITRPLTSNGSPASEASTLANQIALATWCRSQSPSRHSSQRYSKSPSRYSKPRRPASTSASRQRPHCLVISSNLNPTFGSSLPRTRLIRNHLELSGLCTPVFTRMKPTRNGFPKQNEPHFERITSEVKAERKTFWMVRHRDWAK